MGRKRERRCGGGESVSGSRNTAGESSSHRRKTIALSRIAMVIVIPAVSFLVYCVLYSSPGSLNGEEAFLRRRGVVATNTSYRRILDEHDMKVSENSSFRNFNNPVLAYITPWNSQGYEMAKKFINKFTHLSPVWYELKSEGTGFILEGRHNADKPWMEEIQRIGNAQILPRVVLEAVPLELLRRKKQRNKVIDLIVAECLEMKYDGIVLESWSRWAAYGVLHDPELRILCLEFIRQLGSAMHSLNLELIYVISPRRSKFGEYDFGPKDLKSLGDYVDGFSLMTYDYSSPNNPGPNAPIKWIKSSLMFLLSGSSDDHPKLARKIFVGINFYGNDFVASGGLGGGAIVGTEYLRLLEKHRPPEIHWEENSGEHFFVYGADGDEEVKHVVFYPTLASIEVRLEEAGSWEGGISIWEIGQGLEYFFHLL